ncbi:MAG: glycosyltransferase [Vicinamibacteraceae bacterium]|nr:glycosyltransferase [Vicinamibacteraceae bacterium]
MTLLVVCASLDLRAPFSATPAWWQLLKGLYEAGADLHVSAYHGRVPETPWWRAYPNPLRLAGEVFDMGRRRARALLASTRSAGSVRHDAGMATTGGREHPTDRERARDRTVRLLANRLAAPAWTRHLARILQAHDEIDAVLLLSVPPNHLRGVASAIRSRVGKPVIFLDGDAPASLPSSNGFATGFRIYDGADLAEFDAVVSNSEGSAEALSAMGARAVHTLHYAADPQIYLPVDVAADIDVFFYGHTSEYRDEWLDAMIGRPSVAMPGARFAVRGRGLDHIGRAERLPYLSFSRLREYVSRSRVNLVVTRRAHASVYASSTMRPFELAMMGASMVANPCLGMERWFEPGREIVIVESADEAVERYMYLLAHDAERRAIGRAARERALSEHTYAQRARELLGIVAEYT